MFKPKITFNPGPSQIAPHTIQAIHEVADSGILSISHRSPEMTVLGREALENTRKSLRIPEDFVILLQASATMAMDTILRNVVQKKSFHFVNGAFSERFYQTSLGIGHEAEQFVSDWSKPISWREAQVPADTELLAVTHIETSTGTIWPTEELEELRTEYAEPLIAMDLTSSLGGIHIPWHCADIFFSSVQKCMGLPSGMALLIVNPRSLNKAKTVHGSLAAWQDFSVMEDKIKNYQTLETPNMFLLALLGKVMANWDMDYVDACTREKAKILFEQDFPWQSYQKDSLWVAPTVGNFTVEDTEMWHKWARDAGYLIGKGYGKLRSECIRIANFPSVQLDDLQSLLNALMVHVNQQEAL